MRTQNNRRGIVLGIFIILGLVILVAGVLTLGGQKKTFEKKVSIKALFSDVSGLQAGNNVWFSGVKIGTVKKISIIAANGVEVIMSIESKAQRFIKKDAKAKISSEGFIGNKIVVIYGGGMESPSIKEDETLAVEKSLSTDDIMATFQENNKNLLDITANIKQISQRLLDGQGSIGKLLSDETLVNELQVAVNGFRKASFNAQQLTANISAYTAKLQSKGSLTNDLITDTVIFSSLKTTARQIKQASITISELSDNLKIVSANIKDVSKNLNSTKSPFGVLLNDEEAGKNLKLTLANLQSGSEKLDEDLEAMQHNFLFRGYFKKKEKAEAKETKQKTEGKE
jgi:phospholipid/cholesterol/gamma-HCH transport system substrate-binding protein